MSPSTLEMCGKPEPPVSKQVMKGVSQHLEDLNLSSSSGRGGINIYKINEQKEVKKEKKIVQNTQKLNEVLSRNCQCTGCKARTQIKSTRITITHHTRGEFDSH
ncbi:hypothetical protein J6590_086612 [Homalodisca vitripennis]|nr:hypothetical protein J6590_086612 [Homalodisca vitripennis]